MKLIAEINEEKHAVEIKREGLNLTAAVGGRTYEIEVSEPEPNVWLFKHANKIYQIFVAPHEKSSEPFAVNVGGQTFDVKIFDPKRLRGGGGADGDGAHADGASEIKTAMPGKLVRILVETGAEIKKGAGVLIVEAMKMQNELKAPKDGTVKEIRYAEGATVNAGDVLAVIE